MIQTTNLVSKRFFSVITSLALCTLACASNANSLISNTDNSSNFFPYSLISEDNIPVEDVRSCQNRNTKFLELLKSKDLAAEITDLKEQIKTLKVDEVKIGQSSESFYFTDKGFVNQEYYSTSWGEMLPIKDRKIYKCSSYQVIGDRLYCDLGNHQNPFTDMVKVSKDYPLLVSLPLDKFQLAIPEDILWRQRLVDYLNNSNFAISFVRLDDLESLSIKPGQVLLFIDGQNLGQKLISAGYALTPQVPLYISLIYIYALEEAISTQRGLWNPHLINDYGCPSLKVSEPALVEKVF